MQAQKIATAMKKTGDDILHMTRTLPMSVPDRNTATPIAQMLQAMLTRLADEIVAEDAKPDPMPNQQYRPGRTQTMKTDSRGRLSLGPIHADTTFVVTTDAGGMITLTPERTR